MRRSLVLLASFAIASGLFLFLYVSYPISPFPRALQTFQPADTSRPDNLQLNREECLDLYPDLYLEADRARKFHRKGIDEAMVDAAETDGGNARLAIIDNQLYVKGFYGGINSRTQAAIAAVYRTVLTSPERLPDVDFVIQTTDGGGGKHPHFVLDRKADQEELWLMPDFGFFSWPEPGVGAYQEVRKSTMEYETNLVRGQGNASTWNAKLSQLFWRGSPMVEVRHELLRASQDQDWSDVQALDWGKVNDEEGKKNGGDLKSPAEHCQYQFLAHVEGWAYSGRLKYLQQCRSVIVAHPLEWIQHYHHLLISDPKNPKQNMVEVERPLEDHLPEMMDKLLDPANQEWVENIAQNSWTDLREGYISPAANECYYRYALHAYASVQNFKPKIGNGVPYESFLLMGSTHWDPHRRR